MARDPSLFIYGKIRKFYTAQYADSYTTLLDKNEHQLWKVIVKIKLTHFYSDMQNSMAICQQERKF